jgi:hypothetical protein
MVMASDVGFVPEAPPVHPVNTYWIPESPGTVVAEIVAVAEVPESNQPAPTPLL